MIGDVILYGLGYKYGMGFVRRVGKYIGITEKLVLRMEKYFEIERPLDRWKTKFGQENIQILRKKADEYWKNR